MKRFGFSRVTGNPSVRNLRLAREGQLQYCYPRTCFSSVVTMGLVALRMRRWASFSRDKVHYVFPRRPPPASVPAGVQFVTDSVRAFAERLRKQGGKNIWMMGGGEVIGSFLGGPRRIHHHRGADVHRGRHSAHCAQASRGAAPVAISATISARRCSASLRRAATESLRQSRTALSACKTRSHPILG